jgi:hypothetical protein
MASDLLNRARSLFGRAEAAPAAVAPKKAVQHFHAVTIAAGPRACAAARLLQGQRFLSRDAPPLPLKGCSCAKCECHYAHYDDRRQMGRRASDLGVSIDGYTEDEKRGSAKRGRRKSDKQK